MLNVALTSVLGVGFWVVAARLCPPATVGRDSALVSAMLVVSTVCQLNLSSVLTRFLPISKLSPARVVLGAYLATTIVSLAGGTAFVILAPRLATGYRFLATDEPLAVLYVLAVTAWGVFALQDSVLVAIRRAPWVPLENTVFGVLKIAVLPLLLTLGSVHAVFIAWVIPMILLLVPVNYAIFYRFIPTRPIPGTELSPVERFGRRGLLKFFANDYLATILIQASGTLLPVLVVALLGGVQGAYFYMPFTIVCAFDMLFSNVATSMTVEASMASERLPELTFTTARRFIALLGVGVLVLAGGASLILLPFGARYVQHGTSVFRLLVAASVFRAFIVLFNAICRVEGRAARVLGAQAGIFALLATLTVALGPGQGLAGVGLAWLGSNVVVAFAVAPATIRILARGAAQHRATQHGAVTDQPRVDVPDSDGCGQMTSGEPLERVRDDGNLPGAPLSRAGHSGSTVPHTPAGLGSLSVPSGPSRSTGSEAAWPLGSAAGSKHSRR